MWQFAEAVRGLADGCRELGLPVTGGNVSLYNQTGDVAINPTPVIGVLGVHEDVRTRVPAGWRRPGETVLLLGEHARGARRLGVGRRRARPPRRPPAARRPARRAARSARCSPRSPSRGWSSSAHDLSDGGLAQALAESALRHGTGARLRLVGDPFVALFSESGARAVVTTSDPGGVKDSAAWAGVEVTELGTTGGDALVVDGPARAAAGRAARRVVRHAAGAVRHAGGHRGRRSRGHRPHQLRRCRGRPGRSRPRSCAPPSTRSAAGWPGRTSSRRGPSSPPR